LLTLAAASAVLACGPPGCRPEPVNHLGRGFEVVAFLGHPQRGLEMLRCSLGIAQRDEGVAGVRADPQVVGPAGQVGRDSVVRFVGEAGFGEGDGHVSVEGCLPTGVDLAERVTDPLRRDSHAGRAEIEDEVRQPFGPLAGQLRFLPESQGEFVWPSAKPPGCLDGDGGALGKLNRLLVGQGCTKAVA
jgi:hypothetical protein